VTTVLVTGGTGFIGQHIVQQLLNGQNIHVVLLTRGLSDHPHIHHDMSRLSIVTGDVRWKGKASYLMNEFQPSVIFHLAGIPTVKLDKNDPCGHNVWETNVEGTRNLLTYAPKGCRFVLASSATVYGEGMKVFESFEEDPCYPSSLYALSKWTSEELVNLYTRMGHVNGLNLRYIANVGRGATHGLLYDIIRKLKSDSPTLDLLGDAPGSVKPYMHVDDTAAATIYLAGKSINETVNVATPDPWSVKGVAELVMDATGIRKPINWLGADANWAGDNKCVNVSNLKLENLGWCPKYRSSEASLIQAVKELI
jgi:UDP-glucose 4-epimerase